MMSVLPGGRVQDESIVICHYLPYNDVPKTGPTVRAHKELNSEFLDYNVTRHYKKLS